MGQYFFRIEDKFAPKGASFEHAGEPAGVIGPHFVIRNGVERSPHGDGFIGFDGLTHAVGRKKDTTMEAVAIEKLKPQFAAERRLKGFDAKFFAGFTYGGLEDGFSRFDSATGPIDFPRSQTALFSDQEDLASFDDKKQSGAFFWFPVIPIHGHDGRDASGKAQVGHPEKFGRPRVGCNRKWLRRPAAVRSNHQRRVASATLRGRPAAE